MRTLVMGVLEVDEDSCRLLWKERIARVKARDLEAEIIESRNS
jgi:hypothetical protein